MLSNLLNPVAGSGGYYAGQEPSTSNYYFRPEDFGEAAIYALIGFLVVIVGIVIIIAIIWLVGLLMRKTDNLAFLTKKKNKSQANVVEVKQNNTSTENNVADDEVPPEVKAAIVAAIMAYYENSQEKCEFTVKRIKRI
jgi:Na+-transporting methylmalonyl-CoA/oxaloacetate decarboxylase gamma subunit